MPNCYQKVTEIQTVSFTILFSPNITERHILWD